MSTLRFTLLSPPVGRLDLSGLVPDTLAGLSNIDIAHLPLGNEGAKAGDLFAISASGSGDDITLTFEGTTATCDGIGSDQRSGTLVVDGDAGAYAGRHMKGGRLDIRGNAGTWLAAGLTGGTVSVTGSAGDFTGAHLPGEKFGMAGGTVVIGGDAGERTGDRMRRGTIIVKGRAGAAAGSRMAGGTIWAEKGFGIGPGPLMRRGTLIAPSVERLLSTFSDCGRHDLVILRLINAHIGSTLGELAPAPLPGIVRRFAGDMATIGKGELLLTA